MANKFSRTSLAKYIAQSDPASESIINEVAALLISEGRTQELESVMRDVMELRASQDGIVELTATSAFPITSEHKQEIQDIAKRIYPAAKEVLIHEEIDKSMIGGIRLKFANASLDLSIRSKLNKLKEAIA